MGRGEESAGHKASSVLGLLLVFWPIWFWVVPGPWLDSYLDCSFHFMVLYFSIFPFFSSICSIEFLKARAYRISTRLKDIKKLINLNVIKCKMRWDKLENIKNLDHHLKSNMYSNI